MGLCRIACSSWNVLVEGFAAAAVTSIWHRMLTCSLDRLSCLQEKILPVTRQFRFSASNLRRQSFLMTPGIRPWVRISCALREHGYSKNGASFAMRSACYSMFKQSALHLKHDTQSTTLPIGSRPASRRRQTPLGREVHSFACGTSHGGHGRQAAALVLPTH